MATPISKNRLYLPVLTALLLMGTLATPASAQYFGQNKVQYEKFKFQVLKTEHFDIYYYPEEKVAVTEVARLAERWHTRLSKLLQHSLSGRQPLILYASHPHFEQTNVIEGELGEGTGGVTESALRRITMPLAGSLAETDHVLGHELVHAFQYDILGPAAEGLPLWFIEGMAEYLSVGPRDVQTAMWLRDAALQEKLPAIKDLNNPRYFPYRFGHAFWAYLGGRWGDNIAGAILQGVVMASAGSRMQGPYEEIIAEATGRPLEQLSEEWHNAIRTSFGTIGNVASAADAGRLVGEESKDGGISVGPSLSPDGTRIAFLSSRERLSINLYVADAATGKVLRKLIETAADPHFESLQFLQSAGTWDPTGHKIALGAVRKGRPILAIINADRGGVEQEIAFPDLGEIFQPTWSPDGRAIAFSAQVGGFTDLFVHDIEAKRTTRLTEDAYSDLQPAWSRDGRRLAFVTDRFTADLRTMAFRGYGLGLIEVADRAITRLDTGLAGNAVNPQFAADGSVYFLSDAGGRQNLYRMRPGAAPVRLTDEPTGITGITPLSPAFSIAASGETAGVSIFRDGGYDVRVIKTPASADLGPAQGDAALLPPTPRPASQVAQLLNEPAAGLPVATEPEIKDYSAGLTLVGIGQQVGVATSSFGTFFGGGIALQFSDVLGNHLLTTGAEVNGGLRDVGAFAQYLNRTSRWNWGVFGQRAPFVSGTGRQGLDIVNGQTVFVQEIERFREIDNQIGAMTAYPLSRATRIEFSASFRSIGFTRDVERQFFDPVTGEFLGSEEIDLPAIDGVSFSQVATALVRDTSIFGATSPLRGTRLRVEVMPTFGGLKMVNFTADYRRYVMPVRPVTFAVRALHAARYGSGSNDERLSPMFLGFSSLVRGYDVGSFRASECTASATSTCQEFDRLLGSRIVVINAEARAPLVGLFRGNLDYGPLPIEVFGFVDAGVAWNRGEQPSFAGGSRDWVTSAGAGARVNLLGFAIGEFNLARPLNRPGRGWLFVFNLRPGW